MTIVELFDILQKGGVLALLLLATIGGYKGLFIWRWQYDERGRMYEAQLQEARKDRDEYKVMALRSVHMLKSSLAIAETVVSDKPVA